MHRIMPQNGDRAYRQMRSTAMPALQSENKAQKLGNQKKFELENSQGLGKLALGGNGCWLGD
jgi:hypothetical protein